MQLKIYQVFKKVLVVILIKHDLLLTFKKCLTDSNTGANLDAGRLRLYFTDKFNSLMKKLGVKGFRHYTEFQDWQRKEFRSSTEGILFSTKLQDRGIYDKKYLKTMYENHISGNCDYAHLVGTIVGLELWFQNFVD